MNRTKPPMYVLILMISSVIIGQKAYAQTNFSNPQKSITGYTESNGHYNTLLTAFKAAGLDMILNEDGPFTVFAPSDRAFGKLSKEMVADLMKPESKKELQSLLTYHIVAGSLSAATILKAMCRGEGKASFTTVQGDEIVATMMGIDIVLTDGNGNSAIITRADANQCNGVIHEIDSVILPEKI
ncbi:MAG: fasciclin domain-containing protein [Flavobacteriaceae bacterium]